MMPGHAESPRRIEAITEQLKADPSLDEIIWLEAQQATREQLYRCHSKDHVDSMFESCQGPDLRIIDADTAMNPHTLDAACAAAGAVIQASDMIMNGEAGHAFCCVRPPGHHAEHDRAMGFCIFNSVAAGVAHLLDTHRLERVCVLDFDVHHGNGTADIFSHEPRVLFCSSYQYPLYPFSDEPSQPGHQVNTPLAEGTEHDTFRQAIERDWIPAISAFRPQFILVSAGFDAHRADPLAGLSLHQDSYAWLGTLMHELADEHCQGRLLSSLEGGYHTGALASSVHAYLRTRHGDRSTLS